MNVWHHLGTPCIPYLHHLNHIRLRLILALTLQILEFQYLDDLPLSEASIVDPVVSTEACPSRHAQIDQLNEPEQVNGLVDYPTQDYFIFSLLLFDVLICLWFVVVDGYCGFLAFRGSAD